MVPATDTYFVPILSHQVLPKPLSIVSHGHSSDQWKDPAKDGKKKNMQI